MLNKSQFLVIFATVMISSPIFAAGELICEIPGKFGSYMIQGVTEEMDSSAEVLVTSSNLGKQIFSVTQLETGRFELNNPSLFFQADRKLELHLVESKWVLLRTVFASPLAGFGGVSEKQVERYSCKAQ